MTRHIEIDYTPRKAFMPFHDRTQRWACLVAHRRAGKTVAAINDMVRAGITSRSPAPLYAYIAPYRSQAKSVAWEYLKRYAAPILSSSNEQELTVALRNNAKIRLFGADNADAMRGLGFDGVFLDEYGDWRPSVFGNVIRPALSDRQGWAVFAGTPKGKNQFWDIYETSQRLPADWFSLTLTASDSGILPPGELAAAKAQLSKDQYEQEYECSFEAAILGAYFGEEMSAATREGRIGSVPVDRDLPVHTAWDLGYRDDTAIWWYQVIRGEVRIVDYYAVSGVDIDDLASTVLGKGYKYGHHNLPHDARAKTLSSGGKSVIEQLAVRLGMANLRIVPDLSVQDGIQAVRRMLPRVWFDAERCRDGIEALRQYEREYDEDKKAFRASPKHNWCFTGDTEVLIRYGTHQIMSLPYSGEVLTSCGWKRYINPRVTRKNASLVEVRFVGGYSVKCTPDHLFKTANGWISAESLTTGTQIQSALTRLRSISMAVSTVFGQATNTCLAAARNYTETCGAWLLARFPINATFTTETLTHETTGSGIWNVFPQKSICQKLGINTRVRGLVNQPETLPQVGTSQTKEGCGINDTLNGRKAGQNGSANQSPARNATQSFWRLFAKAVTLKNIAALFAKLRLTGIAAAAPQRALVIESVRKLKTQDDVWCLTVPEASEFALANGAIVHNCSHPADAFRMLAIAWGHEPADVKKPAVKTLIVGPENEVSLNDMWAAHMAGQRVGASRI